MCEKQKRIDELEQEISEIRRNYSEVRKNDAEREKLLAETAKLHAEQLNNISLSYWRPWQVVMIPLLLGVISIVVAISK